MAIFLINIICPRVHLVGIILSEFKALNQRRMAEGKQTGNNKTMAKIKYVQRIPGVLEETIGNTPASSQPGWYGLLFAFLRPGSKGILNHQSIEGLKE